MSKFHEKAQARTKQIVGQMVADDELVLEGKEQEQQAGRQAELRGDAPRPASSVADVVNIRRPPSNVPYPAEKARGGEIILNTPGRRAIFIGGLVGAVLLVIVLGLLMAR